jgi:oxygen-independent coproporphyrinogen-3 oxidase
MKFGVYVHIPYCIQRCHYCDFTTFEQHSILPPKEYLDLLIREISTRSKQITPRQLESIYFGGGTPSLFPTDYIHKILDTLDNTGLGIAKTTEVTIEINPATITSKSLNEYLSMGINRFSVGAQTFSDPLLKACGREHTAHQTVETLDLLSSKSTNFSLDILYALPEQSLAQLQLDLRTAINFNPSHISAYCLTLPQKHFMNVNRPTDDVQMEMFDFLIDEMSLHGFHQYELSNFSKPGKESQHNLLYWLDQSYWGIGLSAHSSFPFLKNGVRFWNPKDFKSYLAQIHLMEQKESSLSFLPIDYLSSEQVEFLRPWELLTDFCHISLRLNRGLDSVALRYRFLEPAVELVSRELAPLIKKQWVNWDGRYWSLTREGQKLSNQVFAETTFLEQDFSI